MAEKGLACLKQRLQRQAMDNNFLKSVNRFVMLITIVIDICTVGGYGMAALKSGFPISKFFLMLAILVAGLAISVVALKLWPVKFRYITMISFAVFYCISLFFTDNDHIYVQVFPIIVMYVLYFDYTFILVTSALFTLISVADVIYVVAVLGHFHTGSPIDIPVLMIRIGTFLIFLVAIIGTTKRSNKNNSEKIKMIEERALEAEAASKAKSAFLANMSHEIRTPINAVLGLDTMIIRESKEPEIQSYAVDIENAGQILLALINDILDLSKIESGKMEIIPYEYQLSSLIHDVINMITIKAQTKDLEVKLEMNNQLPSVLYGDDVRIRQVLVNLMNNAVKYTEKGSVTLKVDGTVDNEDVVLSFAVEDTGIGIKEEDMHKLFADFERIEEKRNRNVEGTGLGMSITVQLLSLMESKLKVNSVYGKGSVFSFEIRQGIRNKEAVGNLEKRIAARNVAKKYQCRFIAPDAHVLVVDDNRVNLKVFTGLLKYTKVQVDTASGGKEALSKIKDIPYDIIFLDHMMPEIDGIEVMKQIKQWTEAFPNQETPIIALTANAISGAREEYLSIGFSDYLSKPINPNKLELMISELLPEELINVLESE